MADEMENNDRPETPEHTEDDVAKPPVEKTDEEEEFTWVEDPVLNIAYKGDCAYEVSVEVPVSNEVKQSGKLFDELSREVQVPGFRKGRAPRKLIERKFAKAIKGDVEAKLVSAVFEKLLKDNDLRLIGKPDIEGLEEDKERKEGEPLTFTLKFEVAPRVKLGEYRGVEVERPVLEVADSHVIEAIDDIRARSAVYETLEGGVGTQGDQLIIDFEGMIDGKPFPGGTARDYPYLLGTQRFLPEFDKVLQGSSPGDELSCEVTFPNDYFSEYLRGKTAQFTIRVKEVKRQKMAALTDDFAQQAGFKSVEDMREKLAAELRKTAGVRSDEIAELRALDAIIRNSSFEIPKSLVTSLAADCHESEVRRLVQLRVPMSEIRAKEDELRAKAERMAVDSVKRMITLTEIGRAEDIQVTEEDFEREANAISERTGLGMDAVNQYLGEKDRRTNYENRILRSKAMAVVMRHAKITNTQLSRESFEKETQESEA